MKCISVLVLVAFAPAAASKLNPLSQVISLFDTLIAKITKEGEDEALAFHHYTEWCDDTSHNLQNEITSLTARKNKLQALIDKLNSDIAASADTIDQLAGSLATDSKDLRDATLIRDKETADFQAEENELVDTIDTLARAIGILEKEMAKNPAAFAQVDTSNLKNVLKALGAIVDAAAFSSADKQKLFALVQSQQGSESDDQDINAPDPAIYKTHSTNILDVLEDLKEKAEEQLSNLRRADTNTKHNYEMLKQSLEDSIKADSKDMADEKAAKAAAEEARATAKDDLASTNKDLADAEESLETCNTNCMQTAADHEATTKGREEELKTLNEAKQVLVETTSGAEKQSYSMLQLSQSSRLRTHADLANAEVVTLVKRLAQEHHSAALAQLASRIEAVVRYGSADGEDPFVKVKGLISDLIAKLEDEAAAEATEKAYCDEQIAKTTAKKAELEDDIATLTSRIDKAAAASAALKADVKQLQADLAALAKEQAEMDKVRAESHAAYLEAKADLEQGLAGVRQALKILRDYYGNSAAAAMLQSGTGIAAAMMQPAAPELHEKAQGAGDSIIGILEVVESDFAKNLAEEEKEEADAESEYQKMTQENAVTKTNKDQDVKYKTQHAASLDRVISDLSSDRETATAELSAVNEYFSKIKERCIAKPETYEDRQARRTAEINGLKEALAILEDETAFMQRGKRGSHAHFLGMSHQ